MIACAAKLEIIKVAGRTLKRSDESAWLQKSRTTLKADEDGSNECRPREDETSGTVKGLRTAGSGRVGCIGDARLGSDHNKRRWRGEPRIGSRDRIRAIDCPGRRGRGRHRGIDPGTGKRRHGC